MEDEFAKRRAVQAFSRTRGDDRPISEIARVQHGVVARWQLMGRGWSREEVAWRIRVGRLQRVHAGVYSLGPPQLLARTGRWMAAVLASGPNALLSHWSAAAFWGIRPNGRSRIDVTVPHRSRSSAAIHRHFSQLPSDEQTIEDGLPVTTVPRTIFDLAATADLDIVVAMIREAEFLELWDRLSLPHLLERYPGRRGSRKVQAALARVVEEPSGRKRTKLEEVFEPFLHRHRLPLPRFNDPIWVGSKLYVVDCHWPDTSQIVELDGWEGHGTRSAFRDDRARDRTLRVAGYSVTRLTWNQLEDEPESIASDLRSLLPGASKLAG